MAAALPHSLLMGIDGTLRLFLLDQLESLSRLLPSHDLLHLEIDLDLLTATNFAAFELVDRDDALLGEVSLVVDGLFAPAFEVGQVGVVVLGVGDATDRRGVAKEGAGMRNNFEIAQAVADDEKLLVLIGLDEVSLDAFLELFVELILLNLFDELLALNNRVGAAVLDEEVPEGVDRHTICDLPLVDTVST